MSYGMHHLPAQMTGMNHLIRAKTLDLANAADEEGGNEEELFNRSLTEAEKWYTTASEEEKEALRKRYPEDVDRVD